MLLDENRYTISAPELFFQIFSQSQECLPPVFTDQVKIVKLKLWRCAYSGSTFLHFSLLYVGFHCWSSIADKQHTYTSFLHQIFDIILPHFVALSSRFSLCYYSHVHGSISYMAHLFTQIHIDIIVASSGFYVLLVVQLIKEISGWVECGCKLSK